MDKRVQDALHFSTEQFAEAENISPANFLSSLEAVFNSGETFIEKVSALDKVFDENEALNPLREVYFDLLLINFFTEDVKKLEEDYLDSPEWEEIEEGTLERGTELLNVLLYLRECDDEDIEPELEDYLKEFLLVEEDEFQDEHRIYEDVIANQILTDSSYEEIARTAQKLDKESELKELFYPLMSFFHEQNPAQEDLEEFKIYSSQKSFDVAIYTLLTNY
ncbi:MAG TPA: hypothetical protein VNI52_09805 [Sphingobacteriaceae bacterium]|nr:hypothetical protein [Sphingobacteriaceae bacterium]